MIIKVTKPLVGRFNLAYFEGMTVEIPDGLANEIIECGYAVDASIEVPEQEEAIEYMAMTANPVKRGRKPKE